MNRYLGKYINKQNSRRGEWKSLFLVSTFVIISFLVLFKSFVAEIQEIDKRIKQKSTINLGEKLRSDDLNDLLLQNGYVNDHRDANFITEYLTENLKELKLPNLGTLNKDLFLVNAQKADSSGGRILKNRVAGSLATLGYDDTIDSLYQLSDGKNRINLLKGNHTITVHVNKKDAEKTAGLSKSDIPVEDVWVKLNEHSYNNDSLKVETIAYASTDSNGQVVFEGLQAHNFYSVLPVRKGYEYGSSKGTINTPLSNDLRFDFLEKEHKIRLLGALTYTQIKRDLTLIARSPEQFKSSAISHIILLIVSFWMVHLYWVYRQKPVDTMVLPLLMLLVSTGVLMMYAGHHPLTDTIRGNEMARASVIGVFLMALLTELNIIKLFNSSRFDPLAGLIKPLGRGGGYLFLSLFLATLLLLFGTGPEGSGVKVNLNFGILIQPGELIKYLMIVFFAAYFYRNAEILAEIPRISRIRRSFTIFLGLGVLLFIYLVLGDMGPALVLGLTFILLYAIARNDFPQLIAGTFSYVILVFLVAEFLSSSLPVLAVTTILWFIGWLFYGMRSGKVVYESALFMVLIISAFIFGGSLPGVGERLQDRNEIFLNKWDNQVYGGDQIVQGLWGLTVGGFSGQGIADGSPNVVPAFHTDMIFTTIGEKLGWLGLLLVLVCFAVLLHRSLLIGRKAAHPFAFYLAAGIAIVTGVQLLIITFGSIGLIPLTGVSLPFLSYGKTGLILNLFSFGLILSLSQISGSKRQSAAIQKKYDDTIIFSGASFAFLVLSMLAVLLYYQFFTRGKLLTKPAFAADRSGKVVRVDNPRIGMLMDVLDGGNIYDRNGLLLATGNREYYESQIKDLKNAGLSESGLKKELNRSKKRYYPFGNQTFFMIGDFNTKTLWADRENNPFGYMAEARHLSYLRGFDTHPESIIKTSRKVKPDRYLPAVSQTMPEAVYDYSALIPLLEAGQKSKKVQAFNQVKRDLQLTLDASLQMGLQNALKEQFEKGDFSNIKSVRTSVVVLESGSGDMLASANYPLPNPDDIESVNIDEKQTNLLANRDLGMTLQSKPGSAAKVITAMAAFDKSGSEAANISYHVSAEETFRRSAVTGQITEPYNKDVSMEEALVRSSNVYFIKLANEEKLGDHLAELYQLGGINIGGASGRIYTFYRPNDEVFTSMSKLLKQKWDKGVFRLRRENYYNENLSLKNRLKSEFSYLAWGEGQIEATPLAMARMISIVANGGHFSDSRYILNSSDGFPQREKQSVLDEKSADLLKEFLGKQSGFKYKDKYPVYGKTGTPTGLLSGIANDAWYVFFIYSPTLNDYLSVAVRIERGLSSANAVRLAHTVILPVLDEYNYID